MIDAPGLPPRDVPYIIEELEICIVDETTRQPLPPTPSERRFLDLYFASPEARNEAGQLYHLFGEELPGINKPVLSYRTRPYLSG
jgi:hypothetical protein